MSETVQRLGPSEAGDMAALHGLCFPEPWGEADFRTLLETPGTACFGLWESGQMQAFLLFRIIADEAEILTLAVGPAWRRKGFASRLAEALALECASLGAQSIFLEVAEGNVAARAFYKGHGYLEVGRRTGYYKSRDGEDAIVMRLVLAGNPGDTKVQS